jgi:NAD(P)-dependent dehydrogenase (short-subunit alcohol dehydrogenase family)
LECPSGIANNTSTLLFELMSLHNKVAVITGGNSGIGFATARELQQRGARVIIVGRNAGAVATAAGAIGGDTLGLVADVSRVSDIDRVFQEIKERVGVIDILFVNAGIAKFAPLADSQEALFDEMTDANYKGAFFTVQRALPLLRDGAAVVFTSSTVVHFGMAGASIYAASKAALNSLAKTLAVELAGRKIRVNVVSPGPIATPIFGKMGLPETAVSEMGGAILAQVPLGRFGEAGEVAKAVAYLVSPEATYVTGTELLVDGGMAQA